MTRWLKFNAVGLIGVVVQLAMLALLKSALHMQYLLATALAVEAAVLHNFVWHERWTWRDRPAAGTAVRRLIGFHLTNGLVSIVTNLVVMRLLVGRYHLPYLASNLGAIAAGSLLNFFLSDLVVFRGSESAQPAANCRLAAAASKRSDRPALPLPR